MALIDSEHGAEGYLRSGHLEEAKQVDAAAPARTAS